MALYDDRTLVIRITKYEFIFVMLTELRTGGARCLRYCLSFSVSIKKRGKIDKITKLLRILLLITI